jgi:hypothetical protein
LEVIIEKQGPRNIIGNQSLGNSHKKKSLEFNHWKTITITKGLKKLVIGMS